MSFLEQNISNSKQFFAFLAISSMLSKLSIEFLDKCCTGFVFRLPAQQFPYFETILETESYQFSA